MSEMNDAATPGRHAEPEPPETSPDSTVDGEAQWEADAVEVAVVYDGDVPHQARLDVVTGDLEGRLGVVSVALDPLQLRSLQRELEGLRYDQELAEFVADGGDPELFEPRVATPFGDDIADDEDQYEEEEGDQSRASRALAKAKGGMDPLNMRGRLRFDEIEDPQAQKLVIVLGAAVMLVVLVVVIGSALL